MKTLFLLLSLFLAVNSLFAQNGSSPQKNGSAAKPQEDSAKALLCSNASGTQGFLINKGNGNAEFQTAEQFVKSKANTQSKSDLSRTVGVTTASKASPPTKIKETVVADRIAGRDSGTTLRDSKLPPPLMQQEPPHH